MRTSRLLFAGAAALAALAGEMASAATVNDESLRTAVEKSLSTLEKSGPVFVKTSGCISCHNNTLPLMAASAARSKHIPVDTQSEQKQVTSVIGVATPMREPLLEGSYAIPDTQVSMPYVLMALAAEGRPADDLTAAAIHGIAAKQMPDGSWPSYINRAPIENGEIQATAMSVWAIQRYGVPGRRAEWDSRIADAREWLTNALEKKSVAKTTEDKIMLVSGLFWSGAPAQTVQRAAWQLLSEQRPDGGWAPLPKLESDAYATGKALVALHEAGALATAAEAYRLGAEYLLRTQQADGTWIVKSRAFPFQPLKESGFPHGRDQWISAAATSWAALALTEMVAPEPSAAEASLRIRDQHDVADAKATGINQLAFRGPVQ